MRPVPDALLRAIDPAGRPERLRDARVGLDASSGFGLTDEMLDTEAEKAVNFVAGVVRAMIKLGKSDGTYDADKIYPGEVVDDKGEKS